MITGRLRYSRGTKRMLLLKRANMLGILTRYGLLRRQQEALKREKKLKKAMTKSNRHLISRFTVSTKRGCRVGRKTGILLRS